MEKKDIFDKIMEIPLFSVFQPIYRKYKEILLYLFFGAWTFLISILTYAIFEQKCGMNELIANVISWLIAVLFAFATNYVWVFPAEGNTQGNLVEQMIKFYMGRLFTLGVEEGILALFVTGLHMNSIAVKVVAQVVVIVLNYIISKLLIFARKEAK